MMILFYSVSWMKCALCFRFVWKFCIGNEAAANIRNNGVMSSAAMTTEQISVSLDVTYSNFTPFRPISF